MSGQIYKKLSQRRHIRVTLVETGESIRRQLDWSFYGGATTLESYTVEEEAYQYNDAWGIAIKPARYRAVFVVSFETDSLGTEQATIERLCGAVRGLKGTAEELL